MAKHKQDKVAKIYFILPDIYAFINSESERLCKEAGQRMVFPSCGLLDNASGVWVWQGRWILGNQRIEERGMEPVSLDCQKMQLHFLG